jgi:hypothetical protein
MSTQGKCQPLIHTSHLNQVILSPYLPLLPLISLSPYLPPYLPPTPPFLSISIFYTIAYCIYLFPDSFDVWSRFPRDSKSSAGSAIIYTYINLCNTHVLPDLDEVIPPTPIECVIQLITRINSQPEILVDTVIRSFPYFVSLDRLLHLLYQRYPFFKIFL